MADSSELTQQHKAQALKQKLLDCLKEENVKLAQDIEAFFDSAHPNESEKLAILKSVIVSCESLLKAGDWENSLFLRSQAKRIQTIKNEAEDELKFLQQKKAEKKAGFGQVALQESEREVYISLFQSDGYNLDKWAMQLRSLSRYVVGRPVYDKEEDIQKRIRLRASPVSEAYVVVGVKKADIKEDTFDIPVQDQYGHTLLQLSDAAVERGEIIAFVHQGIRYRLVEGSLVKVR